MRTILVFLLLFAPPVRWLFAAEGKQGMVASVHPLATRAGIHAFENGGNAIDAAVAAGLMLGVVDGFNSGIGGGCFMLIRLADGSLIALDGRETAPAAASLDMYVRDGKADADLSQTGAFAIGVPGSLQVYQEASRRFGKRPLAGALLHAAEIAENGFAVTRDYHRRVKDAVEAIRSFPELARLFLNADHDPPRPGAILKQPELASSYRSIARQGVDWFYKKPFPQRVEDWMKRNDGVVAAEDFQSYRFQYRRPIRSRYRDYEIVGFPPPSSGGIHVAQILNILEHFELSRVPDGSAEMIHLVAEAMKRAFADRAHWLGDSDFADVPMGLVDPAYARELAGRISRDKAGDVESHGMPPKHESDFIGKHTTHFCAADKEGNWVACTATVNTTFGSKVVIPGTGIVMNNQMDDFSVQPGVPNHFGLVGAEANAIEPGKRPLSSMSPTLVLKDGQPVFSVGGAGGPTIISQAVLALIRKIDYGLSAEEALRGARFHHQWLPDELVLETTIDDQAVETLKRMGHKTRQVESMGTSQAIEFDPREKVFHGVFDPRIQGSAAGLESIHD